MNYSLHDYYHNGLHHGKSTDKWELYIEAYDAVLTPYQKKEITLVEIGIQNGGSLEIWSKYFTNFAKIIGCDINSDCSKLIYDNSNIKVIIGDANDDNVVNEILTQANNKIDVFIDDGSHVSNDIIKSFIKYFPYLADDGIYIIEDLHCSYWKEFEGGLYNPMSAMAFLKKLSDAINYEHWGCPDKKIGDIFNEFGDFLDIDITQVPFDQVYNVSFYNSICIIYKKKKSALGKRIIVGERQLVMSLDNVLIESHAPVQGDNYWTGMNRSPEADYFSNQLLIEHLKNEKQRIEEEGEALNDEILRMKKEITILYEEKSSMEKDIDQKNIKLEKILNSKIWKFTEYIRKIIKGSHNE